MRGSSGAATTTSTCSHGRSRSARDGTVVLSEQAVWLSGVLASRDFPIDRLAGNLLIASEVTKKWAALGSMAESSAAALADAAATVSALPALRSQSEA